MSENGTLAGYPDARDKQAQLEMEFSNQQRKAAAAVAAVAAAGAPCPHEADLRLHVGSPAGARSTGPTAANAGSPTGQGRSLYVADDCHT
jgi:hypothetical protein